MVSTGGGVTLDELSVGQTGRILEVQGEARFRRRLLELGLLPGTAIARVGQAPLGDPLSFRLRGAVVTLRAADAARIVVEIP